MSGFAALAATGGAGVAAFAWQHSASGDREKTQKAFDSADLSPEVKELFGDKRPSDVNRDWARGLPLLAGGAAALGAGGAVTFAEMMASQTGSIGHGPTAVAGIGLGVLVGTGASIGYNLLSDRFDS